MFQLILESVKLHGDLVRARRWRAAGRVSHFGGQRGDQISSQVHLWHKYCTEYQDIQYTGGYNLVALCVCCVCQLFLLCMSIEIELCICDITPCYKCHFSIDLHGGSTGLGH